MHTCLSLFVHRQQNNDFMGKIMTGDRKYIFLLRDPGQPRRTSTPKEDMKKVRLCICWKIWPSSLPPYFKLRNGQTDSNLRVGQAVSCEDTRLLSVAAMKNWMVSVAGAHKGHFKRRDSSNSASLPPPPPLGLHFGHPAHVEGEVRRRGLPEEQCAQTEQHMPWRLHAVAMPPHSRLTSRVRRWKSLVLGAVHGAQQRRGTVSGRSTSASPADVGVP
ncbi:unnamed protein product [Mesocestoides corti]|uniref:Uncharacterized protein n=2 Tax=Mesocestoides corti TaxID=53468 RepID=A0A0R3U3Q4_MESCO|nr:unnamed protein product [Mesocestoides corti]